MARSLLLKRPSPLAFPGGSPGFDPSHVAGAAPRLSAVASAGGAFINLLNGKGAALTGPAQGSLSAAGPVNAVGAGTTADNQQFDGSNTFADTAATFGCILIPGSGDMTGGNTFFTDSNAGSGFSLWLGDLEGRTGGVIPQNNAATFPDGGAAVVANVPHFICVVFDGVNNTYTLTKNLATGLVQFGVFTTAGGGTLATASGIPFKIGNGWNIASPSHSKIAAVALSGKAISPAAMRAWADDPWSFWYPQKLDLGLIIGISAGGGTVSLALATTESPDAAAFTATFADQFALAVTEASDIAAFNLGGVISLTLAVTESPDTAAFNATVADQFTLAVTETPDVAAFAGDDPTALSFTVTEAADVAAFSASVSDQFALAATEAADVAAFSVGVADQLALATTETPDTAAFSAGFVGAPVFVLIATETPDVAAFSAGVVNPVATNTGDGGKFKKFREPPHPDWPKPGWPHVVSNPVDLFTQVDRAAESRDALRSAIRNAGKPPLKAALFASTSYVAPAAAPASVVASKGALAKVAAALVPTSAPPLAAPTAQETAAAKALAEAVEEEAIIALLLVA